MKSLLITVTLLIIIFFLLLVFLPFKSTRILASTPASKPIAQAVIDVNMSPEAFVSVNQINKSRDINRQPAGLDFYRVRWPNTAPGEVLLTNGPHSFVFPYTLSVTGTYDTDLPSQGIYVFNINGGMSVENDIYHDDARKNFLAFLSMLKQKGWKRYISLRDPRLTGKQALQYALVKKPNRSIPINVLYSLPIDAEIDIDTWMQLGDGDWRLYAGDLIMKIGFHRDNSRLDLDKPSAYLFTYEVYNRQQLIMNNLSYDERKNAAIIWPKRKIEQQEHRRQKEAVLEQQGYHIDRSYSDPILELN